MVGPIDLIHPSPALKPRKLQSFTSFYFTHITAFSKPYFLGWIFIMGWNLRKY